MEGLLAVLFAAWLGITAIHSQTQPVDCRSCHVAGATSGARDFSHIYNQPESHHRVGIKYPAATQDGFNRPDGHESGIAFFDRNGNGQPDADEIRLFGADDAARVECSTCHQEHGSPAAPVNAAGKNYLRVDNAGSALCTACHNK